MPDRLSVEPARQVIAASYSAVISSTNEPGGEIEGEYVAAVAVCVPVPLGDQRGDLRGEKGIDISADGNDVGNMGGGG